MKAKLFLFVILIFVLLSNLWTTVIEGNTNCYNEPNKNTAAGRAKAKADCVNSTIYSNELKSKDVTAKLNELKITEIHMQHVVMWLMVMIHQIKLNVYGLKCQLIVMTHVK